MDYRVSVLENDLKVIIHQLSNVRTITISLWIKQGSQYENIEKNGISHLVEHLLFDLSRNDEGKKILKKLDENGIKISATTTKEFIYYDVTCIKDCEKFKLCLEALYGIVTYPITEATLNREKKIVTNEISIAKDRGEVQNCFYALWDKYSIALPVLGKKQIVEGITFEEVNQFFKELINPSNCYLAISGDLSELNEVTELVKQVFSKWTNKSFATKRRGNILVKKGSKLITHQYDSKLVSMALGFNGFNFNNPNNKVLDVMSLLLTDGSPSILYKKLREEKKLIYSINSSNFSFVSVGAFIITSSFEAQNVNQVIDYTLKELIHIKEKLVDQDILNRAKQRFITKLATELDNPKALNLMIGRYFALGRIFSFNEYVNDIQSIRAEEVYDIANIIFKESNIAFSASGNFNETEVVNLISLL